MDPLTGLLGVATLSVGSLAFLYAKKQQREGFEAVAVPAEQYSQSVQQSQGVYNQLSQQLNPFANALVPPGASDQAQADARKNAALAFNGVRSSYDPNQGETLSTALSRFFDTPRTEPTTGLIPTIQFCREKGKTSNPFDDEKFAKNCGVCFTDGTDEEGNPFTGPRGLFVFEKEKDVAKKAKEEYGHLYTKAKPSLASCTGAFDQPVFAITKDDHRRFRKRRECQTKKTVGDECGVCFQTQTYGYVEKETSLASIFFALAGQGKLTVKVDGTVIGKEDTALSTSTLLKVNLGTKEGSTFELKVKQDGGKALLYGYLEAQMANKGIFRIPLRRIVQKDEETNAVPKSEPPSFFFTDVGISSTKMTNASSKDQLRVSGILPFSFPVAGEFATLDCAGNPYQTQAASLSAISEDPCAKREASGYSEECLLDRIYGAGCTNLGELAKNPASVNQFGSTLEAITSKLTQIKDNDGITEEDTRKCSGGKPKTPCEVALKTPGAAISAECLAYLYNNLGAEDSRIGSTYAANTSSGNVFQTGSPSLRYCLPSGTLSPMNTAGAQNATAIAELNSKATGGYDGKSGVKAVQAYLNAVFLEATDSTKNVNDPGRAAAMKKCFNEVAAPSTPALADSTNLVRDPVLVQSNAPVQTNITGQAVLTGVTNNDDGSAYIPFSDMDFFFMGTNYKGNNSIYWNANGALGFGGFPTYWLSRNWPPNTGRAILFGLRDGRTNTFTYTASTTKTIGTSTYVYKNFFLKAQNWWSDGIANRIDMQIRLVRAPTKQYVEIRASKVPPTGGLWNISNGSSFLNTFGSFSNVSAGASYVLESDLQGNAWTFYPNYSLSI